MHEKNRLPRLSGRALALVMLLGLLALSFGTGIEAMAATHSAPYRANVKTMKFHNSGCKHYNCKNCVAVFITRQEAVAAGYVPCKVCRP